MPMRRHQASRIVAMFCLCVLLSSVATRVAASPQSERPVNILLFTADDLHAGSVGAFQGRPAGLTPHLDQFASQAMRFVRAHVNVAICAPSRAVIATGLYSHRSGAMGFFKAKSDTPDIVTMFQKAGYLAGILGKVDHSTPVLSMKWDYVFDRKDLGDGRNPEVYYRRCVTFFQRCRQEDKPFYFMVNSHDPHRPFCNPARIRAGAARPSRVYEPSEVVVPGFLPDLPGVRQELAQYLNSSRRLDDTFGRVMQALDESGFANQTLVVFLSDNGIAVPFAKCNAWFHSTRTPLLVRWPGVVEPDSANEVDFVSGIDLFPTFLEATGVTGPDDLDGRSMVSLLQGGHQSGRDVVFTQIDKKAGDDAVPMRCIQSARYGYIYNPFSDGKHRYRNYNEGLTMKAMNEAARSDATIRARIELFRYRIPEEFYDLEKDPNCLHNLIGQFQHQQTIAQMRKRLQDWMEQTGDPMLPAFLHRSDRSVVDETMRQAYGRPARAKARRKKRAALSNE